MSPWDSETAMAKYRRMLNHVRQRLVLTPKFDTIKAKGRIAQVENARLNAKIKPILDRNEVLPDYRLPYYAYSRALDKSQRTMGWMVDRVREHQILRARFEGRGCLSDVLDKLDAVLIYNSFIEP